MDNALFTLVELRKRQPQITGVYLLLDYRFITDEMIIGRKKNCPFLKENEKIIEWNCEIRNVEVVSLRRQF